MSKQADIQTNCATANSLHSVVGAYGPRFSFFMHDGSIKEIHAPDGETALQMLGEKIGKPTWLYRYWLLQEIETCLTPMNNLTGRTPPRNDHQEIGGRDISEEMSGASERRSNNQLCRPAESEARAQLKESNGK